MAKLEEHIWEADFTGPTRRDRRPCRYSVYLPDNLTGRRFALDGDVAVAVADADLVRLNLAVDALADTEALARLLLRAESVASSRIEGLVVGGRRLLRADAARQLGEEVRDVTAAEVLANIDAMVWAVAAVEPGAQIALGILLEVHRRLSAGTRLQEHGGRVPHGSELERRQRLQSLLRRLRAAAAGDGARPAGGPARLLQRRWTSGSGPGGSRPRPVRDHPSLR